MAEPCSAADDIVTAAVLVIGDEILSGRTRDRNIGHIAEHLERIGIRLREARVVPDIEAEIVAALDALRQRYAYVFTTGGIGPTHDDITADSVAKAFGVGISENAEALDMLRERHAEADLNPGRRRMARIPHGATLIPNAVSRAPGFQIGNVFVMAGVPSIMHAMLDALTPRLRGGRPLFVLNIPTTIREGDAAEPLAAIQKDFPDVAIGSYPFFRDGGYGTVIVAKGTDEARARAAADTIVARFRELGAVAEVQDGRPVERS
jgi:molybdenum cofactor synthesis domain-containing protein